MRLGLRGDNAWAPKHVMVMGRAQPDFTPGRVLALAMETDIDRWLSADSDEGRLTMPVRRVGAGTSNTIIRRVLLLIYTDRGSDVDTESDIKLQIAASGQLMLDQKITHDFNQVRAHWHFLEVERPFTRADIVSKGAIHLSILGTDAWLPTTVFVFGLDTEEGRPAEVVTLSAIPKWDLGWLSTDTSEGAPLSPPPAQQLVRGAATMSTIDVLWLAHLNRNTDDAGSDSTINLTINVDGEDVLDPITNPMSGTAKPT